MESAVTTDTPDTNLQAVRLERYKFVTSQCVYCHERLFKSFGFFVTMVSTFAGGVIWLRLQPKWAEVWPKIEDLAVWVLILLGAATFLTIFRYLRAWLGFRTAESELTGGAVKPPQGLLSCYVEIFLMAIVVTVTSAGVLFLRHLQ